VLMLTPPVVRALWVIGVKWRDCLSDQDLCTSEYSKMKVWSVFHQK
jgi:hypothetical protein